MNNGPIKSYLNFIVLVCNAEECGAKGYTIWSSSKISSFVNCLFLFLNSSTYCVFHSTSNLPTICALANNKL